MKRISYSTFKQILKSPAHYKWAVEHPPEPTPAMEFGRLLHKAVLEPKKYQEESAKLIEEASTAKKLASLEKQKETIEGIANAVLAHKEASQLIASAQHEVVIEWDHENLPYKGVLDALIPNKAILDLKTCTDASRRGAERATLDYQYYLQAALYLEGVQEQATPQQIDTFYLLYVEKEPPYGVALYRLNEEWLEMGRMQLAQARELLNWCLQNNQWPSYQPFGNVEDLGVPRYASYKL